MYNWQDLASDTQTIFIQLSKNPEKVPKEREVEFSDIENVAYLTEKRDFVFTFLHELGTIDFSFSDPELFNKNRLVKEMQKSIRIHLWNDDKTTFAKL